MKISELPEPYRALARLRETQPEYDGKNKKQDFLIAAFEFDYTPEGWDFWRDVDEGKHPAIPEISLAELNQIMTIEEIRNMPGSYTMPGFTPGTLYAFWDGEHPEEWTVARYSHSERTTPFDRHWTADKKYFAHVGRLGAWTKGCPASREILAPEEGA